MIKALFFDIDGILVSFKTHTIPDSTIQALTAAKSKGIEIYISTGRPYPLINNISAIEHLIDGYITANGAYCFIGNNIISCSPIPIEEVDFILKKSEAMNFACMVVGEKDYSTIHPNQKAELMFKEMLNVSDIGSTPPISKVLQQPILQLTPLITEAQEIQLKSSLQHIESSRWCAEFADFTAKGVNKAKGLQEITRYKRFELSETMAFGDGGNDLAILKTAGIGIAMGNANSMVKEASDYSTLSIDEDGIYHALKHWNII